MPSKRVNSVGGKDAAPSKDFIILTSSDGTEIVAELDTGTVENIMTAKLANVLQLQISDEPRELYFADDSSLSIVGTAFLPVLWGDEEVMIPFAVAPAAKQNLVSPAYTTRVLGTGTTEILYDSSGHTLGYKIAGVNLVQERPHVFRYPVLKSSTIFGAPEADPAEVASFESPILRQAELLQSDDALPPLDLSGVILHDLGLTVDQEARLRRILARMAEATEKQIQIRDRGAFNFDGIQLRPDAPAKIIQPFRTMSLVHAEAAWAMIKDNMEKHRVRKATWEEAECVSNLVFPRKANGQIRPCSDLTTVNRYTIDDPTPIPSVEDVLRSLDPRARVFAVLDLLWGFWQIPATERAQRRLCFYAPDGSLYTWTVMPFGAKNAPAHFRNWMLHLMERLPRRIAQYFDDLHFQATTVDELLAELEATVDIFVDEGVAVGPSKLQLGTWVKLLGWIRTPQGLKADPDKVAAIKNVRMPKNAKELRSIVGLIRYLGPAVPSLGRILAPLNRLLRTSVRWTWEPQHEAALRSAVEAVSNALLLVPPDPTLPFCIRTDASEDGCGGYLFQVGLDGAERVIWCFSKAFTGTAARWATIDKEAFALVYALDKSRGYVTGRHVTIYTDHKPLIYLLSKYKKENQGNDRLRRWCSVLQAFDFELLHVSGRSNVVADALSRRPFVNALTRAQRRKLAEAGGGEGKSEPTASPAVPPTKPHFDLEQDFEDVEVHVPLVFNGSKSSVHYADQLERIARALLAQQPLSAEDSGELSAPIVAQVKEHLKDLRIVEGKLFKGSAVYVPASRRDIFLFAAHDAPTSGHLASDKTLARLKDRVWWPKMASDVEAYCQHCEVCHRNKSSVGETVDPQPLPIAKCFERVHLDLIGPFPETVRGNVYACVAVDAASKFVVAEPIPDKSAESVARALVSAVYLRYGCPDTIVTDGGGEFVNELNSALCAQLGISHHVTTPYHPASNGQAERMNGVIKAALRCLGSPDQGDWDLTLPFVAFAINTSVSSTTRASPFWLMHGREPRTLVDLLCVATPSASVLDRFQWFRALKQGRQLAAILEGEARGVPDIEPPTLTKDGPFGVGDLVLVQFKATVKGKSRSLLPRQQGPYEVVKVDQGVTIHLKNVHSPTDTLQRHVSMVRRYTPSNKVPGMDFSWEVEDILDRKKIGKQTLYLVTWRGFARELASWIPSQHLNAPELVQAFERLREQPKGKTLSLHVYRIAEVEHRGRRRFFLVALHPDHGPEDYQWVREEHISNKEVISRFLAGGGVEAVASTEKLDE